jgi:hypothetical protein
MTHGATSQASRLSDRSGWSSVRVSVGRMLAPYAGVPINRGHSSFRKVALFLVAAVTMMAIIGAGLPPLIGARKSSGGFKVELSGWLFGRNCGIVWNNQANTECCCVPFAQIEDVAIFNFPPKKSIRFPAIDLRQFFNCERMSRRIHWIASGKIEQLIFHRLLFPRDEFEVARQLHDPAAGQDGPVHPIPAFYSWRSPEVLPLNDQVIRRDCGSGSWTLREIGPFELDNVHSCSVSEPACFYLILDKLCLLLHDASHSSVNGNHPSANEDGSEGLRHPYGNQQGIAKVHWLAYALILICVSIASGVIGTVMWFEKRRITGALLVASSLSLIIICYLAIGSCGWAMSAHRELPGNPNAAQAQSVPA